MESDEQSLLRTGYVGVSRGVITASYFGCFASIGVALAALGPILLALSDRLDVSIDTLGFLFVARSAGYLIGSAAGGVLIDRLTHTHRLLLVGVVLCAVGCAVLPLLDSIGAVAAAVSSQGLCMGVLDTGGNVLLIWLHGAERVPPYMQAMHFFFGLGAFVSPLLIEWSMAATDGDFAPALYGLAIAMLASGAPLVFYRGPRSPSAAAADASSSSSSAASSSPAATDEPAAAARARAARVAFVTLSSLTLLLYVGAEVGYGAMVFTHAVQARGMGSRAARLLNSAFWGSLALGRLLAIPLSTILKPRSMILVDVVGCIVAAAVLLLPPSASAAALGADADADEDGDTDGGWGGAGAWLGTCALGLAMASIFPSVMTNAETVISVTGRITSIFVVSAALGEMLLPLLVAITYPSEHAAFPAIILLACIGQAATFGGTTVAARRLGGDGSGGGEEASKSPAARAATELQLSSVSSCAADEPPKKGADA